MFKRTEVSTALAIAFGGALVVASPLAIAQQEPPAQEQPKEEQQPPKPATQSLDRVEITGSRIKTIKTEGASQVIVLSAQAIKAEGVRSVEQLLNNLPQVMADYGGSVSNGATGTATVDLRNLGRERTLVLVNGRRLTAGSPREVAADLNQIPISLIKQVEVLTGGASAVYGSDAVAGVVNFILNDRFEGVQVEINHSFYNHQQHNAVGDVVRARGFEVPDDKSSDGKVDDINITMGGNFADGKGNATLFFGYKEEDALLQSERDFSACSLAPAGNRFVCSGSSTSFPGRFLPDAGGDFTVADANGGVRDFNPATDIFNFGPTNYFQRPSERYTFSAMANYNIAEAAKVYTELSFHDDHTVAQIAPSGLFGFNAAGANAIRFENPLLSDAWRDALGLEAAGDTADVLILRRNVEGGGRQDDIRHTSFRSVVGIKGELGIWNYDAFTQVGKVVFQETYKNDFSIARTARAMDVVTDPETGLPVCRSVLDGTDPNCVPYNIWSLGGVTPAALAYLQTPGFQKGFTSQSVVGGTMSADLTDQGIKLPYANSGIGVAFGVERRTEKLELSTDAAFTTGDLAGQGGPTLGVQGQYSVDDVFGEIRVPVLENLPYAKLLNITGSYRNSKYYSSGKRTDTYGTGLEWSPAQAVKTRVSYQRAVRAPNVVELFSSPAIGLFNADEDPCAGATPSATLEECARTGVTPEQYGTILDNTAGQYNAVFGGNTQLKPETSDSYTLGVVLTPSRDLSVTIDYFKTTVEDVISNISPTTTLTKCLQTGDAQFCDDIQRDSRGTLWATPEARIQATDLNLGSFLTQGIDFGTDYTFGIGGLGRLNLSFLGTFTKEFVVEEIKGQGTYDCAGYHGATCGNPLPKWRHKLRTSWTTPWRVEAAVTWRFLDRVDIDTSSTNPLLTGEPADIVRTFGRRNYFDVFASYPVNQTFAIRGSVNNVFDKDPPLSNTGAPFGNGNTYPQVYDTLGRRITLSVTAKF
jgi:iron complex outermembrane receptor protein